MEINKNILEIANEIVNKRAEEKEREYGPFSESIKDASKVASILCKKEITIEDFFKCMIALKISRMKYNLKDDTLIDICAYIMGLKNYIDGK